jgi:signal transduction histidine kinase
MVMVVDQGEPAFTLLARMTTRLASMADLDDITTLVSDEIAALGFGAIWIAVLDEPTGHLITVRELIDGRDTTQEMPRISILDMRQPIGHGFRERRMINVQRPESLLIIEEHPGGIPTGAMALPRVIFDHLRGHPFACGPLLGSRGQPVGALGLSSYRGREPLPDELFHDGLLRAFMSHLGIAMERALFLQRLERLNSDLVRTQNLLVQESRMRAVGELASAVAHDLNNLSGIVLMSLGSIGGDANPNTVQCVSRAERANQAIGELSRRLQRIARSGADPRTGPVDLRQLVDDIVVLIKPLCREDAIRLSFSAPDGPAVVQGEQTMVRQAVMNVVLNAREAVRSVAADRRAIDIRINAVGDSICLEVRDQGPGVPRELSEDIFKPFITTKEGHAGLGLATVQGSMKHFGGRVEVLEQPAGGACFRLTFNASLESAATRAEAEPPRARRLRVLVVDDEPEFVAVVRDALVQSGHAVTAADDGDEAMSRVARDDFDVILMDLGLPRRNGLEVIRAMRGEGIASKIVLMTGWDGDAVSADPRVSFCDTLLQKPFRRQELDGVLSSLFQN